MEINREERNRKVEQTKKQIKLKLWLQCSNQINIIIKYIESCVQNDSMAEIIKIRLLIVENKAIQNNINVDTVIPYMYTNTFSGDINIYW